MNYKSIVSSFSSVRFRFCSLSVVLVQSHQCVSSLLIHIISKLSSFSDSKPKNLPRELIDRYKRGDTHPVSALYQLSQTLQFQLDLKETVTTCNQQISQYPSWFYTVHCPDRSCIQHLYSLFSEQQELRGFTLRSVLWSMESSLRPEWASQRKKPRPKLLNWPLRSS